MAASRHRLYLITLRDCDAFKDANAPCGHLMRYPTLCAKRACCVNAPAMSACAAAIDLYLVTVLAYRRAISATSADFSDLSALSLASAASKAVRSVPASHRLSR